MTDEQRLAQFVMELVRSASARCDDVTQQNIAVAKQWINAIVSGTIVTVPATELMKLKAEQQARQDVPGPEAKKAARSTRQIEDEVAAAIEASEKIGSP